jgi:hypothetical protein
MQFEFAALDQPQHLIWGDRIPASDGAEIMLFLEMAGYVPTSQVFDHWITLG